MTKARRLTLLIALGGITVLFLIFWAVSFVRTMRSARFGFDDAADAGLLAQWHSFTRAASDIKRSVNEARAFFQQQNSTPQP